MREHYITVTYNPQCKPTCTIKIWTIEGVCNRKVQICRYISSDVFPPSHVIFGPLIFETMLLVGQRIGLFARTCVVIMNLF